MEEEKEGGRNRIGESGNKVEKKKGRNKRRGKEKEDLEEKREMENEEKRKREGEGFVEEGGERGGGLGEEN